MSNRCLVAAFSDPGVLLAMVERLRAERIRIYDVYSPYPVHGMDRAMGLRRTRLPWIALIAGLSAAAAAILLQFYTAVVDWRMDVGGKPDNSTLAFIPITFELTVLAAGLSIVAALFVRARLFPGNSRSPVLARVTNDRFAIAIRIRDAMQAARTRELLLLGGGADIEERGLPL